ncbi:coordinator of PRMT5 and differentiation stimulator-like isoform X2 [Heptranchias perlo]|uniref:coordinator of PRMT5 and differentiation stimulator-like isoform X2 n=1 Tax=Heptranchias perlo TaxID=212740 RepID=UPI003559EF41
MDGEVSNLVSLPDVSADILQKVSVKENKGLSQELEELHIKSVCQKNGIPVWRPKVGQTKKEQESTLDSDLELQRTCIISRGEDENELEDEDGADYSGSDLSDYDFSLPPEATQMSGMGVELFSEKEDWEKELDEACPYDEDDLEIIVRKGCCEVQLVWQDGETYNPSCDHAPSLRANIVEIPTVQGQFDDADE